VRINGAGRAADVEQELHGAFKQSAISSQQVDHVFLFTAHCLLLTAHSLKIP
jgi:hypothetical protein